MQPDRTFSQVEIRQRPGLRLPLAISPEKDRIPCAAY